VSENRGTRSATAERAAVPQVARCELRAWPSGSAIIPESGLPTPWCLSSGAARLRGRQRARRFLPYRLPLPFYRYGETPRHLERDRGVVRSSLPYRTVREYRKVLLQIIVEHPLSAERNCSWSSVPSFAYGPFCEDTSGSRCDAAPGVASVVVSRRVLSASGSSANISSHIVVPSAVSFARLVVCQAIYRSLGRSVPSPSYRFRPRNYEKLQGHAVTPSQRNRTVPQV
jgi:hypothetical protein